MRKQIIFIGLFIFLVSVCFSQTKKSVVFPDSVNAINYLRLAEKYRQTDIYASTLFAEKAIEDGYDKNYLPAVVRGNIILGRIQEEKNKTAEAYKYYQKAFREALDIKDSSLISLCYQAIGVIYKRLELYSKSVEYLTKALRFSRQSDINQTINAKNILGHVLMDWFDKTKNKRYFDLALENYTSSLNLSNHYKVKNLINNGYVNLANAYMHYYTHFGNEEFIQKSIQLSYKGINYCLQNKHPDWILVHNLNIGEANFERMQMDSAIFYYKKAATLNEQLKLGSWNEAINKDLAMAYKFKGDYENATKCILQAINDGVKYHGTPLAADYRILSELYALKNNHAGALDAYKDFIRIENKDKNVKQTLDLERLQVEYEAGFKDKEIIFLNQEKKIIEEKLSKNKIATYLAITVAILLILIAAFFYNNAVNFKRAKELSDSARVMQEQFLANTSHEIRTPMNGIQGMVNLLLDSRITTEQRQQLETIKNSSEHLLRIINDLLDLSKIKAGKIEFESTVFNIEQTMNLLKELMEPMALNKGISYEINIEETAKGFYSGDVIRLEQILINLISNAVKFTITGGIKVNVTATSVSDDEKILNFLISDTGIGIPNKKLNIVFESFVQLENAGSRKFGGTGLGLSITKQLVELQNGKITVDSKVGKGSEFSFSIPYKLADGEVLKKKTHNKVSSEKRLRDRSFLVIEDNEINQKVILSTLKSWEAKCVLVSSAVEGFEQLMNNDFDLILMDIELPVLNGWDATQYIRLKFKTPKKDIPIIALTAYASEADRNKCLQSGMNDVVTKPFNAEELYVKINNLLFSTDKLDNVAQKETSTNNNLFEELEGKYSDNKEGLLEIYNLYVTELPVYIKELEDLKAAKDKDGIKKQVHKMKSPLGLVASSELLDWLNQLQQADVLDNTKQRNLLIAKVIDRTRFIESEIVKRLSNS
ncbi:MAG: response regulator [Bacteroidia bacterium]|nr:response regulator [Bacteroidia bacterium]